VRQSLYNVDKTPQVKESNIENVTLWLDFVVQKWTLECTNFCFFVLYYNVTLWLYLWLKNELNNVLTSVFLSYTMPRIFYLWIYVKKSWKREYFFINLEFLCCNYIKSVCYLNNAIIQYVVFSLACRTIFSNISRLSNRKKRVKVYFVNFISPFAFNIRSNI